MRNVKNTDRHARIHKMLGECGYTFQKVAAELGVTKQALYQVCNRNTKSARIQERIANITGVKPEDLWPERYGK